MKKFAASSPLGTVRTQTFSLTQTPSDKSLDGFLNTTVPRLSARCQPAGRILSFAHNWILEALWRVETS